jgi:hypothetical protein
MIHMIPLSCGVRDVCASGGFANCPLNSQCETLLEFRRVIFHSGKSKNHFNLAKPVTNKEEQVNSLQSQLHGR